MEFRILGQLEAREGGQVLALGRGKERALLAVLLLSANRSVSVERLLDELWGEAVPETAAKAVQVYVSRLRKALPPGVVHTTRRGYLVEAPPGSLDLERAETLLEQGRSALAAGRAAEAREKLREALALWRGTALAEFTEPFAHAEGARLEELRLACLEERIDADLALRRESDLVGELEVLIARYPLRERARAQLMLALYRVGRQAEALAVYQDARRVLAEELGIEPSQSLRELQRRILNQDAALEPAPPASERGGLPWAVARPGRAGETQLLGRENELARLRGALERALAGRRELVFVTGGPGLGKTALVNAFLDEASAARGLLIARGQCLEQLGAGEPYMPVLEALGRLCREPDGRHLIALMRERAPTWLVQMPWLLPEGELGAVRQRTIGTTPERMLREMGELTHALAGEGAFALVLEDVHWSDPSTLDLLGALARGEEQARLLVIASYRPAEAARHPLYALARDLRARGRSSEVALAPLDADAVGAYLARRFPGNRFPPQVAAVLRKTSGGNPLFMEIVVDSWADEEAFHERDGAWELAVEPEVLAAGVADNLRGLIEQRIERLDLETQETLEAASIAGRRFAAAGVAGASGQTEEEVERRLDTLARHGELLAARGAEEWPDGTISAAYEFLHDLYPTVLYERVPPGRRTRLHKRLGHRLEQGYEESPGAIASVLASHFTRARHAEAAVPYLELAASNATARSAHREAIEHLIKALSLLGRLPAAEERDRRELRLQGLLASGLIATSGWSDTAAERALTRASSRSDWAKATRSPPRSTGSPPCTRRAASTPAPKRCSSTRWRCRTSPATPGRSSTPTSSSRAASSTKARSTARSATPRKGCVSSMACTSTRPTPPTATTQPSSATDGPHSRSGSSATQTKRSSERSRAWRLPRTPGTASARRRRAHK